MKATDWLGHPDDTTSHVVHLSQCMQYAATNVNNALTASQLPRGAHIQRAGVPVSPGGPGCPALSWPVTRAPGEGEAPLPQPPELQESPLLQRDGDTGAQTQWTSDQWQGIPRGCGQSQQLPRQWTPPPWSRGHRVLWLGRRQLQAPAQAWPELGQRLLLHFDLPR